MKLGVEEGLSLAIRYPRDSCPEEEIEFSEKAFELGRGETLRKGRDAAILAYGSEANHALKAADILGEQGMSVTVVDARFAKPLDGELISGLVRKYKHVITVEDHVLAGGFGSAVLEFLSEKGLDSRRLHRIAIPDRFVSHDSRSALLASLGLDGEGIAGKVRSLL
jgi:1-deoxy-D-xylulose-5-phosphate synthase